MIIFVLNDNYQNFEQTASNMDGVITIHTYISIHRHIHACVTISKKNTLLCILEIISPTPKFLKNFISITPLSKYL